MNKYVYCENCGEVFELSKVQIFGVSYPKDRVYFSCPYCPVDCVESKVMG